MCVCVSECRRFDDNATASACLSFLFLIFCYVKKQKQRRSKKGGSHALAQLTFLPRIRPSQRVLMPVCRRTDTDTSTPHTEATWLDVCSSPDAGCLLR